MDIPVPTDSLFCLDGITVSRQPTAVGRMACEAWHYSGTCPASKTIFGFHEGSRFIGVIAFRHPNSNPTSLRRYWSRQAMGDENARVSELTRIALLPQSERKWQTTKMMRLAIRAFRMFEPDVDAIYTYADPAENHDGTLYRAAGYTYLGLATGGGGKMRYVDNRTGKTIIGRTTGSRNLMRSGGDYTIVKRPAKHKFILPISRKCKRRWRRREALDD